MTLEPRPAFVGDLAGIITLPGDPEASVSLLSRFDALSLISLTPPV